MEGKDILTVADKSQNKYFSQKIFSEKKGQSRRFGNIWHQQFWQHLE